MTRRKHLGHAITALTMAFAIGGLTGCGEDPSIYENEKIVFENINASSNVMAHSDDKTNNELSLKEKESSDFLSPLVNLGYAYNYGYGYGYPLNPVLDYYRWPVAVYGVTPFGSYPVDWIHPFYTPLYLNNLLDDDDDGFIE